MGKSEGERPLERQRRKWEDNIKMDLIEMWDGGVNRVDFAEDRDRRWALVNAVMNVRFS